MIIVTTSSGRHWQSRTELVSAPVLRAPPTLGSRVVPGLRQRQQLLRAGDGGLVLLPGWLLGSSRCRGCSLLLKCLGAEWEGAAPWASPSFPSPDVLGAVLGLCLLPWCCSAQPHRSTCKLWLFLFYFVCLFFAFFFFGSKLPPPDALEKARQCAGGCCPTGHQCRAQGPSQPWADEATENGHRAMPW